MPQTTDAIATSLLHPFMLLPLLLVGRWGRSPEFPDGVVKGASSAWQRRCATYQGLDQNHESHNVPSPGTPGEG
jgi:hypothetical protein